MRENRTSGSMRGYWGPDTVGLVRHRQTKGAGTARLDLPSGYQALLYPMKGYVAGVIDGTFDFPRLVPSCHPVNDRDMPYVCPMPGAVWQPWPAAAPMRGEHRVWRAGARKRVLRPL